MNNPYLRGMLLLNVTAIADTGIGPAVELWLRRDHLPLVKEAGLFTDTKLLRLLSPPQEGMTICVQFIGDTDSVERYRREFYPRLQQQAHHYTGQLFLIESVMEYIDETATQYDHNA